MHAVKRSKTRATTTCETVPCPSGRPCDQCTVRLSRRRDTSSWCCLCALCSLALRPAVYFRVQLAAPVLATSRASQPAAFDSSWNFAKQWLNPGPRDAYVLLPDNAPDFLRKDRPFLPPGGGQARMVHAQLAALSRALLHYSALGESANRRVGGCARVLTPTTALLISISPR